MSYNVEHIFTLYFLWSGICQSLWPFLNYHKGVRKKCFKYIHHKEMIKVYVMDMLITLS
jgi:hypothetical protein